MAIAALGVGIRRTAGRIQPRPYCDPNGLP